MMRFKGLLALALLFDYSLAFAQGTQFPVGTLWGNDSASQRPGKVSTVTSILDRAFGSTRGSILERGASGWASFAPSATARTPYLSGGAGADPLYGAYTLPASVTSGGVACFTSTTVQASSSVLSANAIVLGGGAGVCPSPMGSLGSTTTVLHGNAAGAPTFAAIVSADMSITATNCTNQFVSAISTGGVGTCSSVTYASIAAAALAASADLEAGTASKLLSASVIYDGEATVTFNATQTLDFNTFLNARLTLTANITSLTCSNIKASQSGAISFVQSGAGSFTVPAAWCSQFRWASGGRGTLTTGSTTAIDALFYQCVSSSICYVSLSKAQAN